MADQWRQVVEGSSVTHGLVDALQGQVADQAVLHLGLFGGAQAQVLAAQAQGIELSGDAHRVGQYHRQGVALGAGVAGCRLLQLGCQVFGLARITEG